jgi:hypothetical protein
MSYYFSRMLPVAFDEALKRTTEALKREGLSLPDVRSGLRPIGIQSARFGRRRILLYSGPAGTREARPRSRFHLASRY